MRLRQMQLLWYVSNFDQFEACDDDVCKSNQIEKIKCTTFEISRLFRSRWARWKETNWGRSFEGCKIKYELKDDIQVDFPRSILTDAARSRLEKAKQFHRVVRAFRDYWNFSRVVALKISKGLPGLACLRRFFCLFLSTFSNGSRQRNQTNSQNFKPGWLKVQEAGWHSANFLTWLGCGLRRPGRGPRCGVGRNAVSGCGQLEPLLRLGPK